MPAKAERYAAKLAGADRYFTGKSCPRGHVAERYTGSGGCTACVSAQTKKQTESGYFKKLYADNHERVLLRQKARYLANPGRAIASAKAWVAANPEKRRAIAKAYKHRRRAQTKGGATGAEQYDWENAQAKVCWYCDAACPDDYHVDHLYPLSKGGAHAESNWVIACPACNMRKNAKDPEQFMHEVLNRGQP